MKKSTLLFATACLVLAAGIGASAIMFAPEQLQPAVISSGTALVGGPFEATNQDGKRVSEKDFLGKNTIYYFGYTYCPDICPAELQVISAALSEVPDAAQNFNLVFVTVDPDRDTPAVMKEYVSHFWPGTTGLTGSGEDLRRMASAFRVYYGKVPDKDASPDNYLMDHSSIAYLMGPDGAFVKHFAYGTSAEEISKTLVAAASN
jgi:protein SCO1/2